MLLSLSASIVSARRLLCVLFVFLLSFGTRVSTRNILDLQCNLQVIYDSSPKFFMRCTGWGDDDSVYSPSQLRFDLKENLQTQGLIQTGVDYTIADSNRNVNGFLLTLLPNKRYDIRIGLLFLSFDRML